MKSKTVSRIALKDISCYYRSIGKTEFLHELLRSKETTKLNRRLGVSFVNYYDNKNGLK